MRVLCTTTSLRCCYCVTIVFIVVLTTSTRYRVDAFDTVVVSSSPVSTFSRTTTCTGSSTISLFSVPPSSPLPQRQPRRNLQKRPRKNRKTSTSGSESQQFPSTGTNDYYRSTFYSRHPSQQQQQQQRHVMEDFPWETAESRTIISAAAREAGEDYWIDIEELQRIEEQQERLRQQRVLKSRDPNQISDQKLWIEVLSPYKQNWIGLISVSIIALAFIFKYFPEVIDPPIITNIPELL